jgi:hypothetical protein
LQLVFTDPDRVVRVILRCNRSPQEAVERMG